MLHLHVHSVYSYKKSIADIESIAQWEKDHGQNSFCITDTNSVTSFVKASIVAAKLGMKFIQGMDVGVQPEPQFHEGMLADERSHLMKERGLKRTTEERMLEIERRVAEIDQAQKAKCHRLVLLAQTPTGLKNLMDLYSTMNEDNGEEAMERDVLKSDLLEHSDGILCLFNMNSEVGFHVRRCDMEAAKRSLLELKQAFGDGLYLLLERHYVIGNQLSLSAVDRDKEESDCYRAMIDLARENAVGLVAGSEVACVDPSQRLDLRLFQNVMSPVRLEHHTDLHHMCSAEELRNRLSYATEQELDEAFENITKIDNLVDGIPFPRASSLKDAREELRSLCETGWERLRKGTDREQESRERLEYELEVIESKGFSQYFVKVLNIIAVAKELNVMVGPARGSGGGSELCFLTGITRVDPLKYGLYFERFLNPGRKGYPDIDLDFSSTPGDPVGLFPAH